MPSFLYQVFIHCNTAVCQPSLGNNCEPRCFRKSELYSIHLNDTYAAIMEFVLSIFPLFSTKMNTEYSLLDHYFEVLYRNSMWHENLEKLNIFSLKE